MPYLLADAGESIVGIIVFVIAFIGWIVNMMKESGQVKKSQQRRGQQRRMAQNEIDDFLNETKRQKRPEPARPRSNDIEVVETPSRRAPKKRQRVSQPKTTPPPPRPVEPVPQSQPLSSRHISSRITGSELQQHVEQAVPHTVDRSVESHFGTFKTGKLATRETIGRRAAPATKYLHMMRSKQSVKMAIVINEILSKPHALRPKS